MLAAIDVQQHAYHRPARPSSAMCSALAALRDWARSLPCFLHPGIAQLDAVFLVQLLVEMPHVQIVVAFQPYATAPPF